MRLRETKPQARIADRIKAELREEAATSRRRAAGPAVDLGPFRALVDADARKDTRRSARARARVRACSEAELRATLDVLTKRGARLHHVWAALVAPWALPLPRVRKKGTLPKLGRSAAGAARVVEREAMKVWPSDEDSGLPGSPVEQLRDAAESCPPEALATSVDERGRRRVVNTLPSTEGNRRWVAAVTRARAALRSLEADDSAGYLAAQPGGERIGEGLRLLRAALETEAGADDVRTREGRQRDHFAESGPAARALAALHVGSKVRGRLLRWSTRAVEHSKLT